VLPLLCYFRLDPLSDLRYLEPYACELHMHHACSGRKCGELNISIKISCFQESVTRDIKSISHENLTESVKHNSERIKHLFDGDNHHHVTQTESMRKLTSLSVERKAVQYVRLNSLDWRIDQSFAKILNAAT